MSILVYDEIWVREPRLMVPRGALAGLVTLLPELRDGNSMFFPFFAGITWDIINGKQLTFTNSYEITVKDGRRCLYLPAGSYATVDGGNNYTISSICGVAASAYFVGSSNQAIVVGTSNTSSTHRIAAINGAGPIAWEGGGGAFSTGVWSSFGWTNTTGRYCIEKGVIIDGPRSAQSPITKPIFIGAYGTTPTAGTKDMYLEWVAVLNSQNSLSEFIDMTKDFNRYLVPA